MRIGCVLLLLSAFHVAGQTRAPLEAPLIGYVRDTAGALRPVAGVAGAFVLGDAVATGVLSSNFKDDSGCAVTAGGVVILERRKIKRSDTAHCPEPPQDVGIEGDEIVIRATGTRLRAPAGLASIEQMGDGWFVLRTEDLLYALRATAGREAIYVLPESGS